MPVARIDFELIWENVAYWYTVILYTWNRSPAVLIVKYIGKNLISSKNSITHGKNNETKLYEEVESYCNARSPAIAKMDRKSR